MAEGMRLAGADASHGSNFSCAILTDASRSSLDLDQALGG
jgi:hypothetical protein